jgi:ketosteroid isomerase-like protein
VRVRVHGDTAVITGRATVEVRMAGRAATVPLRFLDVWVKREGRWRLLAWQSTRAGS